MDWKSSRIDALLEQALVEDQAARDATTNLTIDPDLRATASIIARQEMVVCGLGAVPRFLEIFARLDPRPPAQTRFEVISHPEIFDGVRVHEGQVLAVIRHNARVLLSCERVILNLMQHLSGIATLTRQYVDAIQGTHAHVLDTRKTVPGLRILRSTPCSAAEAPITASTWPPASSSRTTTSRSAAACRRCSPRLSKSASKGQRVQVEVRNRAGAGRSAPYGAEAILLDNMTPAEVKRSVERIKEVAPGSRRKGRARASRWIPTEASGGIVLENIRAYAETGVDFISVGALTHSAKAADISMRIEAE